MSAEETIHRLKTMRSINRTFRKALVDLYMLTDSYLKDGLVKIIEFCDGIVKGALTTVPPREKINVMESAFRNLAAMALEIWPFLRSGASGILDAFANFQSICDVSEHPELNSALAQVRSSEISEIRIGLTEIFAFFREKIKQNDELHKLVLEMELRLAFTEVCGHAGHTPEKVTPPRSTGSVSDGQRRNSNVNDAHPHSFEMQLKISFLDLKNNRIQLRDKRQKFADSNKELLSELYNEIESLREHISSESMEIERRFGLFLDFRSENKLQNSEIVQKIRNLYRILRLNETKKAVGTQRDNDICFPIESSALESNGMSLHLDRKEICEMEDFGKKLQVLKEKEREIGNGIKENEKEIAELKEKVSEWSRLSKELRENVDFIKNCFIEKCKRIA
jgi:hypothetical protein